MGTARVCLIIPSDFSVSILMHIIVRYQGTKYLVHRISFAQHLSLAQSRAILEGHWPAVPVFSPFAETHDGYSQGISQPPSDFSVSILMHIIVRYQGTKYLVHRISFAQHHGEIDPDLEVSHIFYIGVKTSWYDMHGSGDILDTDSPQQYQSSPPGPGDQYHQPVKKRLRSFLRYVWRHSYD